MKTEYLTKFDDGGHRETTVINGVHYATDEERQMYIDDGYISISEEDYQHYIGNRGVGENGSGYIRDVVTGKPVSAPPASPVTENEDSTISSDLMDIAEIILDMSDTIKVLQKGVQTHDAL